MLSMFTPKPRSRVRDLVHEARLVERLPRQPVRQARQGADAELQRRRETGVDRGLGG